MFIKDLELAQDLSREEAAAVRGGDATNLVFALQQGSLLANGGSAVSIGSPVVQANPQSQTITPTATNVDVDTNTANVVASALTGILQF